MTVPLSLYNHRGSLYILAASFIFSSTGAVAKYLEAIPAGQYAATRCFFGTALLIPLSFFQGISLVRLRKKKYVFTYCFCQALAFTLKIFCIKHMRYGDATALYFTAPIFAGIFARVIVQEEYGIPNIIATILGLGGVVLVAKPSFIFGSDDDANPIYPAIAVFAASCTGFAITIQRKIGKEVRPLIITTYAQITAILVAVLFEMVISAAAGDDMRKVFVAPECYDESGILMACGLVAAGAQILYVRGVAIENAAPAMLVRNMDTVIAYVIQVVAFKDPVEWSSVLGAGLIIGSTCIVIGYKAYKMRVTTVKSVQQACKDEGTVIENEVAM